MTEQEQREIVLDALAHHVRTDARVATLSEAMGALDYSGVREAFVARTLAQACARDGVAVALATLLDFLRDVEHEVACVVREDFNFGRGFGRTQVRVHAHLVVAEFTELEALRATLDDERGIETAKTQRATRLKQAIYLDRRRACLAQYAAAGVARVELLEMKAGKDHLVCAIMPPAPAAYKLVPVAECAPYMRTHADLRAEREALAARVVEQATRAREDAALIAQLAEKKRRARARMHKAEREARHFERLWREVAQASDK